jgi:hypothetical protein
VAEKCCGFPSGTRFLARKPATKCDYKHHI